jgi:DNA-binding NtrC family response regulator
MSRVKVLLIDDEVEFASALSERLQLRNYDAKPVYNAEEALSLIRSDPPHVVLLDLKMPGSKGEEVLKTIKKMNPAIEVIIVTGVIDLQRQVEGLKNGAFDYILKPLDIEEVITKIDKAKKKRNKE